MANGLGNKNRRAMSFSSLVRSKEEEKKKKEAGNGSCELFRTSKKTAGKKKKRRVDWIKFGGELPHVKRLTLLCQLPLVTRKTISDTHTHSRDCQLYKKKNKEKGNSLAVWWPPPFSSAVKPKRWWWCPSFFSLQFPLGYTSLDFGTRKPVENPARFSLSTQY